MVDQEWSLLMRIWAKIDNIALKGYYY